MHNYFIRIICVCTMLLIGFSHAATAQPKVADETYPRKTIQMIVPLPPGGGGDVIARIAAARLAERLNVPVVVENHPGAASMVGSRIVARATPDGYTLLIAYANHTTAPYLYGKLPYDPVKDFSPVSVIATQPLVVLIPPSLPVNSVDQLVALAKAKPGVLNYGVPTIGSMGHIAAEMFKQITGTNIVAILYKGGAPAQMALMTSEVQLVFGTTSSAMPHIKSGRVKALATTSKKRLPYLPEVPTVEEVGLKELEIASSWIGMLAPAGTPRVVIDRLRAVIVEILKEPATVERLAATGSDPVGNTPEEFAAEIARQLDQFGKVIKTAGIKAD